MAEITVYGANWCIDTRMSRRFLDERGVLYNWVDIDLDPRGLDLVKDVSNGERIIPVVVLADGAVLVEPSTAKLARTLGVVRNQSALARVQSTVRNWFGRSAA